MSISGRPTSVAIRLKTPAARGVKRLMRRPRSTKTVAMSVDGDQVLQVVVGLGRLLDLDA